MFAGGKEPSPDLPLVQFRQCVRLRQDGIVDDESSPRLERRYQLPQNLHHIRIRPVMEDPAVQIDISGDRLLLEHVVGHEGHPIGKLRWYEPLGADSPDNGRKILHDEFETGERVGQCDAVFAFGPANIDDGPVSERGPGVAFGQELGSVAFVRGEGGHRSGEALCFCRVCLQMVEY